VVYRGRNSRYIGAVVIRFSSVGGSIVPASYSSIGVLAQVLIRLVLP
jgi:hypothetical protein